MKALIVAMLITIMPFYVVAEEDEQATEQTGQAEQAAEQTEEAVVDKEKVYYVEESDNDSDTYGNWRVFKGYCPLEVPTSLSYKEEQERRAKKGKR